MGTNYYARVSKCASPCDHCETSTLVHLGKSSVGWKFVFNADPEWPREDALDNWLDLIERSEAIEDEYSVVIDKFKFLAFIMHKQNGRSHLVDHGPDITGPYFNMFSKSNWDCKGFDFTNREFS